MYLGKKSVMCEGARCTQKQDSVYMSHADKEQQEKLKRAGAELWESVSGLNQGHPGFSLSLCDELG